MAVSITGGRTIQDKGGRQFDFLVVASFGTEFTFRNWGLIFLQEQNTTKQASIKLIFLKMGFILGSCFMLN
ncbi:MAG: hypothetical protein ACLFT3_20210 [Cyclobacteriaceae bacterium]